jgi:hypothetical protein
MKICPVGAELFLADGQTDTSKLVTAFRNFANAPKNPYKHVLYFGLSYDCLNLRIQLKGY